MRLYNSILLRSLDRYKLTRGVSKRQSIPATRQVLQDSVMRDLNDWLLSIREKSRQIGEIAFRRTEKKRDEWRSISENDPILSSAGFNSALQRVYDEQDECLSHIDVTNYQSTRCIMN